MRILSKCFREYICHIFVCVNVGLVDNLTFVQISTIMIANVDVLSSSFDNSFGDKSESSRIVTVDWQRW